MVAKVNEKYASVVADGINPTAKCNALSDVLGAKLITGVCS
jgi:hypothetical protein